MGVVKDQTITNGNSPATQHDLAPLAGRISERLDGIEGRVSHIEDTMATKEDLRLLASKNDLAKVLRVQEAILTTVQAIDGKLHDISDHTERIIRLEEHVFGSGH
jgi:hypothetical protein